MTNELTKKQIDTLNGLRDVTRKANASGEDRFNALSLKYRETADLLGAKIDEKTLEWYNGMDEEKEYDVHVCAVVRVKVKKVKAKNHEEAIEKAVADADLIRLFPFQQKLGRGEFQIMTEYADEISEFLVEPAGNGDRKEGVVPFARYEEAGPGPVLMEYDNNNKVFVRTSKMARDFK